MKLKKITFVSTLGKYYWHVLYDGDTVGRIVSYSAGWQFFWSTGEPHGRPDKVRDAIKAVAEEKTTLLNIVRVLTQ